MSSPAKEPSRPSSPAKRARIAGLGAVTLGLGMLAGPSVAHAGPGTTGVRHMGMGEASRASAYGIDGAMNNPSAIGLTAQFALTPGYQLHIPDLGHGISAYVMDSLNNPRFSLALGYEFLKASPKVGYIDAEGQDADFKLSHFGHEVSGSLNIAAVKQWWWFAVKPKFVATSLRYLDDDGAAIDATPRLRSFGMDVATTLSFKGWVNVAFVASNIVGNNDPAWTEDDPLTVENVEEVPEMPAEPLDLRGVRRVSDYPLTLAHGLSVQPLRSAAFSLNFDGMYDLTSYKNQDQVRMVFSGGAEFVVKNMVPLRAGVRWDGRGKGKADDELHVSGGVGFVRTPRVGGTGFDVTASFSQQVQSNDGTPLATSVGIQVGLLFHPDL